MIHKFSVNFPVLTEILADTLLQIIEKKKDCRRKNAVRPNFFSKPGKPAALETCKKRKKN